MKTLADAAPQSAIPEDDAADHEGPLRRCLVTRERQPRETMLRFVVTPEQVSPAGGLVFDVAATLPGRGMWLSAGRDVIDKAIRRGAFARAAGRQLDVPERLADHVTNVLENRIVELLGLARRAGAAVTGFEKVKERLAAGQCALLVEASDGSQSELDRLLQRRRVNLVQPLPADRLGAVFGRDRAVHVAIGPGRLAGMIGTDAARLARLRGAADAAERLQALPGAGRESTDRVAPQA